MKGFILRVDSTLYGLNSFITFIMIPDTMLYKAKAFDTFNPFDFPLLHYFIFNFLLHKRLHLQLQSGPVSYLSLIISYYLF